MENEFITINHVLKYMWQAQTDEDNEIAYTVYASMIKKKKKKKVCSCSILFMSGFCFNSLSSAENNNRGVAMVHLNVNIDSNLMTISLHSNIN